MQRALALWTICGGVSGGSVALAHLHGTPAFVNKHMLADFRKNPCAEERLILAWKTFFFPFSYLLKPAAYFVLGPFSLVMGLVRCHVARKTNDPRWFEVWYRHPFDSFVFGDGHEKNWQELWTQFKK